MAAAAAARWGAEMVCVQQGGDEDTCVCFHLCMNQQLLVEQRLQLPLESNKVLLASVEAVCFGRRRRAENSADVTKCFDSVHSDNY